MHTSLKDKYAVPTRKLRAQLGAFSLEVRESARVHYESTRETQLLSKQIFQCQMIGRIEKLFRSDSDSGTFIAAGGHESGVYETFFRICPGRYMSKSLFSYAISKVFGSGSSSNALLVDSSVNRLFETFDTSGQGDMDWRSFLCLLVVAVQPLATCLEHLRYMFAFYASCGDLELTGPNKLTLGVVKEFVSFPATVSLRPKMRSLVQNAYDEVAAESQDFPLLATDDSLVSLRTFLRMFGTKVFREYMAQFRPFGKTDPSPWIYRYEDEFYCPVLVRTLEKRRREGRNSKLAAEFRAKILFRWKKIGFFLWQAYLQRRHSCRVLFLYYTARKNVAATGRSFDKWRKFAIADHCARALQRVARGFIGRARASLTRELVRRSVLVQSVSRSVHQRKSFKQLQYRRRWGATTIQRHARGFMGRSRVASIVMALFDAGLRQLNMDKRAFEELRRNNASTCLQRFTTWCLRRKRALAKMTRQQQMDSTREAMDRVVFEAKLKKIAYQQALQEWYRRRKEDYELSRMREHQTAEEKAKIVKYRRKMKESDNAEFTRLKAIRDEEEENRRVEEWIARWDKETILRKQLKYAECQRALSGPTNPAEELLQKEIKARTKKHVKVVLRKADTMRLPMEIPEATIIASKEVVDEIVLEQVDIVKAEMRAAAEALGQEKQRAEALRREVELKNRQLRSGWAQLTIVNLARSFAARKSTRELAYLRYAKSFDAATGNCYYTDVRTGESVWDKPKSLGAYDIDVPPGWVVMHDSEGDRYFYYPLTWTMSVLAPRGTALCDVCCDCFAIARYAKVNYCAAHFNDRVAELEAQGLSEHQIIFQLFDGNLDGSTDNQYQEYGEVSVKDYRTGTAAVSRTAVVKVEEEEEDTDDELPVCDECGQVYAQRNCDQCNQDYCSDCFIRRHAKAPWNKHTSTSVSKNTREY